MRYGDVLPHLRPAKAQNSFCMPQARESQLTMSSLDPVGLHIDQISDTSSEISKLSLPALQLHSFLALQFSQVHNRNLKASGHSLHLGDLRQFTGADLVGCSHVVGYSQEAS